MKIAIIGCGNMGLTYARSFLKYDLVNRESLLLVARSPERAAALEALNLGTVIARIGEAVATCEVIVIAVKPQDADPVYPVLKPFLNKEQVVFSVMAGIPIEKLEAELRHPYIIRAMPNTPAQIGMGMTAFAISKEATVDHLRKAEKLFSTTGRTVFLESESLLNAVTAVSGSGPAYFYYIVKAMIEAGKSVGLDESLAALLVKQTMMGAYHLMNNSTQPLDALIKAVASKGGTTEAALKGFEENGVAKGIVAGMQAAEKRAFELAK